MFQYISLPVDVLKQHPKELKVYAVLRAASELAISDDYQTVRIDELADRFGMDRFSFLAGICILRLQGFVLIPSSESFDDVMDQLSDGNAVVQLVDRSLSISEILDLNPGFPAFVESCAKLNLNNLEVSKKRLAILSRVVSSAQIMADAFEKFPDLSGLLSA